MSYELSGKVIEVFDAQQVTERFKKREFVVEKAKVVNGTEYSDYVKFQLTQNRCDLADTISTGDMITVSFDVRGNRWEKNGEVNYFTNLEAWRIQKEADNDRAPAETEEDMPIYIVDDEDEDLPF